jgi:alpha-beta hydrolase superfamily lysophospholipase
VNSRAVAPGEKFVLAAEDGQRILVHVWQPESPPRAVLQLLHGLGEHIGRYGRFARACNRSGYVLVAHNHRGHGEICDADELGHYADNDGWTRLIEDSLQVQENILRQFPDIPLVLMGHSMGSYIAQSLVMRHPQLDIRGLVLSATTLPQRLQLRIGRLIAHLERLRIGPRGRSGLLNTLGFGNFNKPFKPARTEFDWLSRDDAEVDKYVADPLCGGLYTCQLWLDLTNGLLEISDPAAIARVSPGLPLLITGGENDAVGGEKGLSALAAAYESAGHNKVKLRIYPGGRHEMLNETNRDEVTSDILTWIESILPGTRH